jgi:GNAT superfamily N-acetyltransferase
MEFVSRNVAARGIRISVTNRGTEIGRAYVYLMHNDLHDEPFGLLEDVFVSESHRGQGVGSELVRRAVNVAKEEKCYKLIATSRASRPQVHQLYRQLGFAQHGFEFRIDI